MSEIKGKISQFQLHKSLYESIESNKNHVTRPFLLLNVSKAKQWLIDVTCRQVSKESNSVAWLKMNCKKLGWEMSVEFLCFSFWCVISVVLFCMTLDCNRLEKTGQEIERFTYCLWYCIHFFVVEVCSIGSYFVIRSIVWIFNYSCTCQCDHGIIFTSRASGGNKDRKLAIKRKLLHCFSRQKSNFK